MKKYLIGIIFILCTFANIQAQTIYVKIGGNGNGTSWSNALGDLQQAINAASSGSEIWVATGTYHPISCNPCSFDDRNASFQIPDGVKLYGGFSGSETSIDQRNITNNPTLLSGDIDQNNDPVNNSFSIVYFKNVSNQTVLDGFTLTGGKADWWGADSNSRLLSGAAIYNDGSLMGFSSNPTINNCLFVDNHSSTFGGAVFNYGGFSGSNNSIFNNCQFKNNSSVSGGGAMYNNGSFSGECNIQLNSCSFENNFCSFNGGAVYNQGNADGKANGVFLNCSFKQNSATVNGGAVLNFGNNGESSPLVQDCIFESNTAQQGAALYNDGSFSGKAHGIFKNCDFTLNATTLGGGSVYNLGSENGASNPGFINCNFIANQANSSGGAFFSNGLGGTSNAAIINCVFSGNSSNEYGGAIYNLGKSGEASPVITNCMFIDNSAIAAGAIYNLGSDSGNSSPEITNCTFFGNNADVGACIYNQANDFSGNCSPVVTNCIAWDNIASSGFGTFFQNGHGTPSISHCLLNVSDCSDLNTGINGTVTCGPGLIFNQNPMFADTNSDNFHLQPASPAIDKGNNTAINATGVLYDLDSLLRVNNGTVDLGAYEFNTENYTPPALTQHPTNQIGCEGVTIVFSIVVDGTGPMVFQWKKNGINIPQANENEFVISQASLSDNGNYSCKVTGLLGEQLESNSATLTVNPNLNVAVIIQASATQICEGETIEFTTFSQNGGASGTYEWQKNGLAFGSNSSSININSINDGDVISCQLTSSENCTLINPANSNQITIGVNPIVEPQVSITASSSLICQGEEITFNAIGLHTGANPQWQWMVNGQNRGENNPIYSTTDLANNDLIICKMTSSESCSNNAITSSEIISIQVVENTTSEIEIEASTNILCQGTEVILNAQYSNGGDNPQFQWFLNNQLLGLQGNEIAINDLETDDVINCKLISTETCISNPEQLSNSIEFTVNPNLMVSADINASDLIICQGEIVHFEANVLNGGSQPIYNWHINGSETNHNSNQFDTNNLNNGDLVSCLIISSETCTNENLVISNQIEVEVNPILEMSAQIETNDTAVCFGQEVQFTLELENAGDNPEFLWQVNGENRSNASSFTFSNFNDGDQIQCVISSTEECLAQAQVQSNSIQLSVGDVLQPSVQIQNPAVHICEDGSAILHALPHNGGNTPTYEWFHNGLLVGDNESILHIDGLAEGDSIWVILHSSIYCASQNIVESDVFNVVYSQWLVPQISIQSNDSVLCEGDLVLFTTSTINEGGSPQFDWYLNGNLLEDHNSQLELEVQNQDQLNCVLTSSERCANPVQSTSNQIDLSVQDCTVATYSPSQNLQLEIYPNPSSGLINIKWTGSEKLNEIELVDLTGRLIKSWKDESLTIQFLDCDFLPNGSFYLIFKGNGILLKKPIIIAK